MRVLFFAEARRAAGGRSEQTLQVERPIDAEELWRLLLGELPELEAIRSVTRLARNGDFAGNGALFHPGDEVALIPPVSGG